MTPPPLSDQKFNDKHMNYYYREPCKSWFKKKLQKKDV